MEYKDKNMYDENSFRARSLKNQKNRKKLIRKRILVVSVCIVFVTILICAVWKISEITKSGSREAKKTNSSATVTAKPVKQKETATPVPTPAPTKKPEGKEKWLRKDLDPDKPMIALTFDDGPYSPVTARIVKTLKKYDSRATFFTVGNRIPSYKSSVKKAYNQGNQIASHTYGHVYLTKLNKKQIKKELDKSNKAIKKAIGCGFDTLRPPGGLVNDMVKKVIDVPLIYWNVDTQDWMSRNSQKILAKCQSLMDGDIVLMHDLYPTTADAVNKLVPKLIKKGFQLVTIDELFYYKDIDAKGGAIYYSGR